MKYVSMILGVTFLVGFQNCSGVNFQAEKSDSASQTPAGGPLPPGDGAFGEIYQGLSGGHFDLDTSSAAYPLSQGRTDHHVHEYDDKYNVTYADYFNLLDPKFNDIDEIVAPATRFVLVIANAQLSPGGVLSLNGQQIKVTDYQSKVDAFIAGNAGALPVFTLNGSSGQKLSDLKIGFPQNALSTGGLIGTVTGCVVKNDPGKLGEYRNGALTIQAIDVAALKLNSATRTAEVGGGLLWESTIFWHWDNACY